MKKNTKSSEKRFKDALAKIEKLEGKFCTWEKAPEVGVGMLTSEDQKTANSCLGLAIWRDNARIWQHLALSAT